MLASVENLVAAPSVSWKSVAVPAEHGGWGMLAEPVLLALLVAPSPGAAFICVAALIAFLLRQPLKLWLSDRLRGASYPRTGVALRVALVLSAAGLLAAAAAAAAIPAAAWLPALAAAPCGLVQLHYDVRRQGRHLLPELLGSAALGAIAAVAFLASGLGWALGLGAWLLLAAKNVAAVLYVRARFRLERAGERGPAGPALLAQVGLVAVSALALAAGVGPSLAVLLSLLLLARAAWGLSPWHRAVRPQAVGLAELGWGLLWAAGLAFGYRLG